MVFDECSSVSVIMEVPINYFSLLVCSVAFRTTPMDDTGVSHILEHTVLCGSAKYPCRDPFFKMLNRSLATFMNAFTCEWQCACCVGPPLVVMHTLFPVFVAVLVRLIIALL